MKLPIHAAIITHAKGAIPVIASSYCDLISQIGDWCREHWSSVSDDPPPQNKRDLVDAYFRDNPDASLDVAEGGVDFPEPYASAPKLLAQLECLLAALCAYKPGDGEACAVLCREVTDTRAVIAKASGPSVPLIPSIPRFTVFCQEAGCSGDTVHISSHAAVDLESAIIAGKQQCVKDWSSGLGEEEGKEKEEGERPWTMETVHCLGVAAGDVNILHWEDQPQ
jgi:hypothetical protein